MEQAKTYRNAQVINGREQNGEPFFEVRLKGENEDSPMQCFRLTTAAAHTLRSSLHDSLIMQVRNWAQGERSRNLNLKTNTRGATRRF